MKIDLPAFQRGKLLIVGDLMLDRYWSGRTSRISPEAPVPVVHVSDQEDRAGGAANVALNVAALGSSVTLVGITGEDEAGQRLTQQLNSAGIQCNIHAAQAEPTITKLRVMSRHQQLIRLDFEEPFHHNYSEAIAQRVQDSLAQCDVVVLSDYGKGTLTGCAELIQQARRAGKPVLVDPKGTDFEKYRGATLLTPNLSEFEAVVGHCDNEQQLVERGQALIQALDLSALLVTRSEHGMTLLQPDQPEHHFPAEAREVFDVTGAGDTVISTLAAALAAGSTLDNATAFANVAAGIVVSKMGTAAISAPELQAKLRSRQPAAEQGVVTLDQLLMALTEARARGEKVVFTNGCFDILHAGHVGYLAQARALGDRLIVGVNSDASVTRLKGEGRPINSVERRMTVLSALASVDWVLPFGEDTPIKLIEAIKPDVLVKGGDYTVEQVVGADLVHSYGGDVALMSFLDNCSTTLIVDKIKAEQE